MKVKYNSEPYDKSNKEEQWIRISDGCPHNCPYCYTPTKLKEYTIPKIARKFNLEPKIELFARERREGWDVFGNEVPDDTQTLL